MQIFTGLLVAIFSLFHPIQLDIAALSTQYRYSQYCLQAYRDQHGIDSLLPEYGRECNNNSEFRGNIDDPELYTFAGERYLEGKSPASLNWESQPLTKYFFGFSLYLFGNVMFAQYALALASLYLLCVLSRRVLSPMFALIPSLLLMVDPLFIDQLRHSYLDLSLTFWVLLWLLYLGSKNRDKLWWVGGVVLGALALSKSFSFGILAATVGLIVAPYGYLKAILVSIFTYFAGYTMFFVAGHTPLDFLTLHVNTLWLYRSYVPEYPKGEIFRIVATGQWRTWWGDKGLVPSPFYTPLWTIGLVSALYLALCHQVRQHHVLFLHLVWVFLVLGFISLRLVFPRYLLPLLPSLYLLLVVGVKYAIDELRFMFADTEAKIKTKIKNHFCESRTN